jgi:integrase
MPRFAPSYLLRSRHGIFYFRLRMPISLGAREASEVRISLRTRCRATALAKARKLRVQIEAQAAHATRKLGAASMHSPDNILLTDAGEILARLIRRGKELYPALERVEREKGDGYDHYSALTEYDQEALDLYGRVRAYRDEPLPNSEPSLVQSSPANRRGPEDAVSDEEPIASLIDRFMESKKNRTKSTVRAYRPILDLFLRIVIDASGKRFITSAQLEKAHIRQYALILPKWPKYARLRFEENVNDTVQAGRPPIAVKTLNQHFGVVRQFIQWIEKQQYTITSGLDKICPTERYGTKGDRLPLSDDELRLLFESKEYQNGLFKRNSDYWVPLIALFTGARQAEICQLHTSDVRRDEVSGNWVIDFNSRDGKSLKTSASARCIPVHDQLIELGLAEFIAARTTDSDARLFPEETRNDRGEFRGFSARFQRYRKTCGIHGDKLQRKDFHSLRHTVVQKMTSNGIELYLAEWFVGHKASSSSQTVSTYSRRPDVISLSKCLDYLDYAVDFNKIKPWSL